MKIKLFLSASLAVLGLWLAAAFLHTVDVASYHTQSSSIEAVKNEGNAQAREFTDEPSIETASLSE
ncbi:hypothetical protein [Rubritalea sp.]|uniref:hypothetical protein n=1 Tax=Rubritalea sp. TaxID=2109375 RepID=UPI003EF919F9